MRKNKYCTNCGNQLNENIKFCPYCGTENRGIQESSSVEEFTTQVSSTNQGYKEIKNQYCSLRIKCLFIGAFLASIIAFLVGMVYGGVALAICGVLLVPPLVNKYSSIVRIVLVFVTIVVAAFVGYQFTYRQDVMAYVKQYHDPDSLYSIEEYIDTFYAEADWKYDKKNEIEYITVSYKDVDKSINVIFKIDAEPNDYPILYDVLVNGESDKELFRDFDSILFGNGEIEQGEIDNGGNDVLNNNENEDKNDESLLCEDKNSDIYKLISRYIHVAYIQNDMNALSELIDDMTNISFESYEYRKKYIELYDNIECYKLESSIKDAYIVFVTYDVKLYNIETLAPSAETFIVKYDNVRDKYYIHNLTSAEEYESYMSGVSEIGALQQKMEEVKKRLETALSKDQELRNVYEIMMGVGSNKE